jgi:hypothetical protein
MVGRIMYVDPRRRRRLRPGRKRRYANEDEVTAEPITLPITESEVRAIASRGFPLWESIEVMQLRNRRITLAYSSLSSRLADVIAQGDEGSRDANWCTFATWSSRTIGASIDPHPVPPSLQHLPLPRRMARAVVKWTQQLLGRDHGALFRSLAVGNRFVFLEVGAAIACFIDNFEKPPDDEGQWSLYWERVEQLLAELGQLDPSWLPTTSPDPQMLRSGLRFYFDATRERDRKQRAELVLAGNLMIGAYEQRRVDGYLATALALWPGRSLRLLVQQGSGRFGPGLRRRVSSVYSWLVTRFLLVLVTVDEVLKVGRPLPPVPYGDPGHSFPEELRSISHPALQALLSRYDQSDGKARRRRAKNWIWFDDRMNYITNFFRSRQRHDCLFDLPFPAADVRDLLHGRLPPPRLEPEPVPAPG